MEQNQGNFTADLENRARELAQMQEVYSQIRQQGMDLYTFCGDRLVALPDMPRNKLANGKLELTKQDYRTISLAVKRGHVQQEIAQKTHLMSSHFYSHMDECDLARKGMEFAWDHLEGIKKSGLTPFTSSQYQKSFSLESLQKALRGEMPTINNSDLDLC